MRKIWAFVRLDMLSLKPYRNSLLLLLGMGVVMGAAFQSVTSMTSIFLVGLMMVMSYPFAIAEKSGTDRFYATLSLRRAQVVVGRYAFAALMQLAGLVAMLCVAGAVSAFFGLDMEARGLFAILSLFFGFLSLTVSFQYPIFFKTGYTRAKLYAYLPLILLSVLIGVLPALIKETPSADVEAFLNELMISPLLYILPVLAGLLLLAISCAISCRIYEKRDL